MNAMNLSEAQLFRLMVGFFGEERVIWSMSVRAVCGGAIPELPEDTEVDLKDWAIKNKCLFTVVDDDGIARMVVELEPDLKEVIDLSKLLHKRVLPPILNAAGIKYVSMRLEELTEMMSPDGNLDFYHFLEDKVLG